jgi:site-specific DNA-methyltransferase (cytosine-N4-specific)
MSGHPARFPEGLPEFFIRFLTDPTDVVLDVFAGSNTTGAVAEALGRRWIAFEIDRSYLVTSAFRFLNQPNDDTVKSLYSNLMAEGAKKVAIPQVGIQQFLFDQEVQYRTFSPKRKRKRDIRGESI